MAEILAYVHKDGFFHRLHPVTKILFILIVGLMSILSTNLGFLALLVLSILIISCYANLGSEVLHQFRLIVIMSVILIGITIITMPSGEIYGLPDPQRVPSHWRKSAGDKRCC